jgi:RNA polymerase sigma factor (TIGR02999 family)
VHDSSQTLRLLRAARDGDARSVDLLFAHVYEEVRTIARRQLSRIGRPDTLDTTAVVHEAYLKLVGSDDVSWDDRSHFLNLTASVMRQVLVDHARTRTRVKRGGGARVLPLVDSDSPIEAHATKILELEAALARLSSLNERLARVVELRFYGGLTYEDAARILGVTDRTVKRDWRIARAFLYREIGNSEDAR